MAACRKGFNFSCRPSFLPSTTDAFWPPRWMLALRRKGRPPVQTRPGREDTLRPSLETGRNSSKSTAAAYVSGGSPLAYISFKRSAASQKKGASTSRLPLLLVPVNRMPAQILKGFRRPPNLQGDMKTLCLIAVAAQPYEQ